MSGFISTLPRYPRNADPPVRQQIRCHGCAVKPGVGGDHDLVAAMSEPGRPPAERRVGNDVVATCRHEPQFIGRVVGAIDVDELCIVDCKMIPTPGEVVRKYEVLRAVGALLNHLDRAVIIGPIARRASCANQRFSYTTLKEWPWILTGAWKPVMECFGEAAAEMSSEAEIALANSGRRVIDDLAADREPI